MMLRWRGSSGKTYFDLSVAVPESVCVVCCLSTTWGWGGIEMNFGGFRKKWVFL